MMSLSYSCGPFYCSPCNLSVNSEHQLHQHFAGSKHLEKVKANGNLPQTTQSIGASPLARNPKRREDQIRAAGMSYFVKEKPDMLTKPITHTAVITDSTVSSLDSSTYCATCRCHMTSASQAQVHYEGAKHQNKLRLHERMMHNGNRSNGHQALSGQVSAAPDDDMLFCYTCCVKLTSLSQAQSHYSGAKHKSKLQLQLVKKRPFQTITAEQKEAIPTQEPTSWGGMGEDTFCSTCRIKFTSAIQARTHYEGGKHKQRLRLLEETRNDASVQNHHQGSSSLEEGEPTAKKRKFTTICEACNVVLTCPDMASSHYRGAKHQRTVGLLRSIKAEDDSPQLEEGGEGSYQGSRGGGPPLPLPHHDHHHTNTTTTTTPHAPPAPAPTPAPFVATLYCSFCELRVNSKQQMEAHQTGYKHKAIVEAMGYPDNNRGNRSNPIMAATPSQMSDLAETMGISMRAASNQIW